MVASTPTTEVGRLRFEMRQRLGMGSFGEVYLATMASGGGIQQEVAVKVLHMDLDPRSQPVARLRDEGRILGGLNHPVILQVRDLVVLQGRIGLVMEFVPGADLSYVLDTSRTLEPRVALQIVGHVGDALDTAFHAKASDGAPMQLVHRDVKPANIRLTPHGTVKLLDFGIAKAQQPERESSTAHVVLMGSLPYMAPEVVHLDVEEADMARDIFALGCVLYECLAGALYFEGLKRKDVRHHTARQVRYDAWLADRMAALPAGLEPGLVALLSDMLAYDAADRPSAREVADRAHELAEEVGGSTLRRWARAFPWPMHRGDTGAWTGQRIIETTIVPGAVAEEAEDAPIPAERAAEDVVPLPAPAPAQAPVPAAPPPRPVADDDTLTIPPSRAGMGLWWAAAGLLVVGAAVWGLWPTASGPAPQAGVVEAAPEPQLPAEVVAPDPAPPAQEADAAGLEEEPSEEAPEDAPARSGTPEPVPDGAAEPVTQPEAEEAAPAPKPVPPVPKPVAAPAPKPVAPKPVAAAPDPRPAPVTPAPAPAPTGTVRLDRAEDFQVELRGASGRRGLGAVPAGRWTVYADFGDGLAKQLDIQVGEDATVVLRCRQILAFCEVL